MKPTQAPDAPVRKMTPAQIAEHARAAGRFGIDTEFVSESRYRALLGLVQVVVSLPDGGQHIELLDPLDGFDHEPLAAIWADPDVEVVIHAGGQDVAILRRAWGVGPTNVFDTQVAAGFAGFSAQAGYGNLLQAALGVRLAKSAGIAGRSPTSSSNTRARTWRSCSRWRTTSSAVCARAGGSTGRARSAGGSRTSATSASLRAPTGGCRV
jgi:hypothetical protein